MINQKYPFIINGEDMRISRLEYDAKYPLAPTVEGTTGLEYDGKYLNFLTVDYTYTLDPETGAIILRSAPQNKSGFSKAEIDGKAMIKEVKENV